MPATPKPKRPHGPDGTSLPSRRDSATILSGICQGFGDLLQGLFDPTTTDRIRFPERLPKDAERVMGPHRYQTVQSLFPDGWRLVPEHLRQKADD